MRRIEINDAVVLDPRLEKGHYAVKKMRKIGALSREVKRRRFSASYIIKGRSRTMSAFAKEHTVAIELLTKLDKAQFVHAIKTLRKGDRKVVVEQIMGCSIDERNCLPAANIVGKVFVSAIGQTKPGNKQMDKPKITVISKDEMPDSLRGEFGLAHEITTLKTIKKYGVEIAAKQSLPEDDALIEEFRQFEGEQLAKKLDEALASRRELLYTP